MEATARYPEDLARLINESVFVKQQIFSVDETALYWEKMPFRTLITRESACVLKFQSQALTSL